jgi:hypothetical protein
MCGAFAGNALWIAGQNSSLGGFRTVILTTICITILGLACFCLGLYKWNPQVNEPQKLVEEEKEESEDEFL